MAPTETITPPAQETPAQPSQQDVNRTELYQKYYGTQEGVTPTEAVPPAPAVAALAPPPPEPVASPVATLPPEIVSLMQSMQVELTELKTKLTPAAPAAPADAEASWIGLLREGKIKEAEDALAESVAKRNQAQIIQQAVTQAREIARAEAAVERHVAMVRGANPELAPMEPWIASVATARMQAAQTQGLVKSTDDAIRIYTTSVDEAVESARKVYLTLRGEGQQQAMTRNREVLSSQPIPPQQVDTSRPQVTGTPADPAVESPQDYLAKRTANQNRLKGLGS